MSNIAPLTATPDAPPSRWRATRALARGVGWLAAAVFTLLLGAWLALHWAILPHIERWRPLIESKTGAALGVPVRIGRIEVRSSGWVPTLELNDVALLDAREQPALQLARVVASVSARSMLASLVRLELRLSQLLIDGAQLEVRRDKTGQLFVAGLEFSGATADSDTNAADWFFRQREIVIRGATLRWTDEQRGAPPLALTAVDLIVHNSLRAHDLRLDATPPADWGERFSLRGKFTQPLLARSGDWEGWTGEVYVDAPRAVAGELYRYIDLPFELTQGEGAVRAWLGLRTGAVETITLDLALRAVALRLAPDLQPLAAQQLQGRLQAKRRADGGSLALRRFEFLSVDGVHWPPGDLDLAWTRSADGAVHGGEFSADRLDLAVLAQTASRLPLAVAARALLAETNPQGIASAAKLSWTGPPDALVRYQLTARLAALSIDAKPAAQPGGPGRPGLRNAALDVTATEKGGQASVSIKNGALDLPGVFAEPLLPLDEFAGKLQWRVDAAQAGGDAALQVQLSDARLANADLQGQLSATWKTGAAPHGRFPGALDLDATLSRAAAARTARYLPLTVPEGTRRYLQRALQGGSVTHASFRVKGNLADFPFTAAGSGEFRVAIQADDLTFAYVPSVPEPATPPERAFDSPWPPMTQLAGELIIDRNALQVRQARAQLAGLQLEGLQGGIANFADKPVLTLQTQARGPAAGLLQFVNATPVGSWIGDGLREASIAGDADLKLALTLPLAAPEQSTVSGSLQLAGGDLRLRPELPLFAGARGRADFTNKSVTLANASARVLGGDAVIDGGTQPDGSLRFNARGSVTAEALRGSAELGAAARLAGVLSGQAAYRLSLGLGRAAPEIDLASDLAGMAIDLPPPLKKAAETALPLHLQTALVPGPPGAVLDTLRIELGATLRAQFQRDVGGESARVLRGGIGVYEPAPTPASGVAAAVTLERLDVDAWDAAIDRLFGTPAAAGASAAAAPAGYAPTQLGLKAQELHVAGRTVTHVTAGLSQLDGVWRATLEADQAAGYVEYRAPGAGAPAGRVYARLARLAVPKSDADEAAAPAERQPRSVPTLDVVIDELEWRGRPLGRFEVQALNREPAERAWELMRLNLKLPEAQLNASGRWAASTAAARGQTTLRFDLDLADSGALLARFGTPDAVRGGKGQLKGQLAWPGSPLAPEVPALNGQVNIAIEAGQFLQVNSGAARLLGVLSMQSLARRLTGDFRDLFEGGFAFDSIAGDVKIGQGLASTNNLLMRGPQAVVAMEGSADLRHETQDMRVVVVPEINLGAASLAYAVVNPVIGLGTFMAQLFLREPLARASTREFHVTGPWADPQVEQVAHLPGPASAPAEPPAAAAGASSPSSPSAPP